ncbi:uncharacterized protein K02A2.6-like isoform X2 [Entelurus aequoreus]|uniref:uncharacterized protein K02A2.6-like isoform X2 n=1 Tax=Entelurus aequoreus TaxID=161455 RepID=UPI002B1CFE39|nr:uncharacterized protein K02A2.6-like isoform X2 [Entelurus aequoreus]
MDEQQQQRAALPQVPQYFPPSKFDFSKPEEWPRWSTRFNRYRIASGLDKQSQEFQVNAFMYSAGEEAEDVLKALQLTEEQKKSYNDVTAAFEKHCVSKRNVIYERACFNRRCQQPGETVESFITAVHTLAEHCEFGTLRDELIRDRLVVGILDARLSERLQLDAELTLEKAITQIKQSAAVKKQQPGLRGAEPSAGHVEAITKNQMGRKVEYNKTPMERVQTTGCGKCGNTKKHPWKECPARDAECHKCHKRGHFAKICRSAKSVHDIIQSEEEEFEFAFLGEVSSEGEDEWIGMLQLNGRELAFKLDTGAAVNAIPSSIYFRKIHGALQQSRKVLYGPGQHRLEVDGCFKGGLTAKGKTTRQDVYVVNGLSKPLIGLPAIKALDLVRRVDTVETQQKDFKALFPTVFTGLGKLKEPYTIALEPDAVPYALSSPRRVPLPLCDKVKKELDRMVDMGVISRVTQPTPWCAGLVVVPKPNGKMRLCVDLTHLNGWIQRERYILPAVDHTLGMLAGAKTFTKLDATSGFWQIPLAEESKLMTTFITPFGRYAFNRLPFGISSAPEHFQRRMLQMLESCAGAVCHADDILVYGDSQTQHDERLCQVLKKLQEEGLTLNGEKCEFSKNSITFLGHRVSVDGVTPDIEKIKAIQEMPAPTDVEGVKRLMGMANYLSKFLPHLASYTRPIKDLLCGKNEWCWEAPQEEAFKRLKQELSSTQVLAAYSPTAETCVSADASSFGLGGVLTQQQSDGAWRPIIFISRGMSDTERHYAQIEKEALAATWACERLSSYLLGLKFRLETDHKPLVPLLSTKALDELPPRVLRFRLRLLRFCFDIVHVPGKSLITADTLSRAPIQHTFTAEEKEKEAEVKVFLDAVTQSFPATEHRLNDIAAKQKADPICAQLIRYCETEWPERHALPQELALFWPEKGNLTMNGQLLLRGQRIVIPGELRGEVLQQLHSGHQGVVKCRARARQAVWWPGLSSHIRQMVENCNTCSQHRAEQREPLLTTAVQERPWQRVGTDLFFWKNSTYLLVVDYFSRYIEVAHLEVATAETVVAALKDVFSRHGTPETVFSDNGPQYSGSEFQTFARAYGFAHVTGSPRYPQANGEAERAVATVKGLWKGGGDKARALQTYRATPLESGYSPAQLLMGRQIRSDIPQVPAALRPRWPGIRQFRKEERRAKEKQQRRYNQRHRVRVLPQLQSGQEVWLPKENKHGTVVQKASTPRSYIINTEEGSLRRNRTHMRPIHNTQTPDTQDYTEHTPEPGGSGQRKLCIVPPEAEGYTGRYLSAVGRGKSALYIVPVQGNLDMTPLPNCAKEFERMPKATCHTCSVGMPVQLLAAHVAFCGRDKILDVTIERTTDCLEFPENSDTTQENSSDSIDLFLKDSTELPSMSKVPSVKVTCPICQQLYLTECIEAHASFCGERASMAISLVSADKDTDGTEICPKRRRHQDIKSIADIIQSIADKVDPATTFHICITRDQMLERGEAGIDSGALRKEFLTEMLAGIERSFFEGGIDGKVPKYSMTNFEKYNFKTIGEIFAVSLAQWGPPPNFLMQWCYSYISTGEFDQGSITEKDVVDLELMELIKEIEAADSELLMAYTDRILSCGYTGPVSIEKKDDIVRSLVLHSIVRLLPMLQQISSGMKLYDLLTLVQQENDICRQLFVPGSFCKVDADFLVQSLSPVFSEIGTMRHQRESTVVNFLQDFVQAMEDEEEDEHNSETREEDEVNKAEKQNNETHINVGKFCQWLTGQSHICRT